MNTGQPTPPRSIDPDRLDLIRTDGDTALYYDDQPLATVTGSLCRSANYRLMTHLLRDMALKGETAADRLNTYTLFSYHRYLRDGGPDRFGSRFSTLYQNDPLVKRTESTPTEASPDRIDAFLDFFDRNQNSFSFVFGGMDGLVRVLNAFLLEKTEGRVHASLHDPMRQLDFFQGLYQDLSRGHRAAVACLSHVHHVGVLLPLLLAFNKITPSEYAHGLFVAHLPRMMRDAGTPDPEPLTDLMALTPELPDLTAPEERFNRLKMQAASVLEYLYYHEQFITGRQEIKHLIRLGESYSLEFKSTLRQNLKSGKKDPQIEHACLKTMAAFLNSNGGVLLIGVRDDGEILGVEADGFANQDIYAQHFWNLVKASMGVDHTPMIQAGFESVDDKTVFRVDCVKSPRPVFLKQKGFDEEFFIRVGPSSAKLGIMEALQYIGQRFESHE